MQEIVKIYEPNPKNWKIKPSWFGSAPKYNRFDSVLQKLAKIEPNRLMLTPISDKIAQNYAKMLGKD